MSVASAAACVQIFFWQHGLRPVGDVAMGIGRGGGSSLAAVTDRAAVRRRIMDYIRVATIEPVAFDTGFAGRHADVAAHAAVGGSQFAADDLAQLNGKRDGLGGGKLPLNLALDNAPVAQKIFIDGGPQKHR